MTSLSICDRTSGQSVRTLVKEAQLSDKVYDFRSKVSKAIDVPVREIELIYRGMILRDDCLLESYGLTESSTVHVLKKNVTEETEVRPEPMDSAAIQQVVTALQAALINPAHRNTVDSMMSRPETLENLVAATPGLDRDPIALAMLQDPELLAILADPENIHKVIEAHPSLGHAAMMVATAINEESAAVGGRGSSGSNRATYSLDQMSDDEDLPGPSLRAQAQPITASQLAAALAATGGGAGSSSQADNTPAPTSSSAAPPGGAITADFLQQAMMEVTGAGGSEGPSEASTVAALQQLRDMGITDEARARRALGITGGNIQAALELLFGDNDL